MSAWRIAYDGNQYSGESAEEVLAWWAEGRIPSHAHVYHPSLGDWVKVTDLADRLQPPPPPPPEATIATTVTRPESGRGVSLESVEETFNLAKLDDWKTMLLIGLVVMAVGGILVFPVGKLGLGFFVLWVGAALTLKKMNLVAAIAGALVIALVVFLPLESLQQNWAEGRKARAEAAAARSHADDLMTQINQKMEAGEWEAAGDLLKELRTIPDTKYDSTRLNALWGEIEPKWKHAKAERAEAERRAAVQAGVAMAADVVSDHGKCESLPAVADAWKKMKLVKKEDPEWARAVSLARQLERCRAQIEQQIVSGVRQFRQQQRIDLARKLRTVSLDNGMDIEYQVAGNNKDHLILEWALMGAVIQHQITEGGSMRDGSFLLNAQKAGFRRVSFRDGFDYDRYFTLEPDDERQAAKKSLGDYGLSGPISLK